MNPNCLLSHREREKERERENRRSPVVRGWSGDAMVLGKYSEPKRHTNLVIVGQGSIAPAVGAGGVVWNFFLSSIFSLFFLTLWETARYRLKYCLKGPLNPKQLINQIQP